MSPRLLVPWGIMVCWLASNDANAVALIKLTRARGMHPKDVAPYPSRGVIALINASFIECCVAGTMPGSGNSKVKNTWSLPQWPHRLVKGADAWQSTVSVQNTVESGKLAEDGSLSQVLTKEGHSRPRKQQEQKHEIPGLEENRESRGNGEGHFWKGRQWHGFIPGSLEKPLLLAED